MIERLPCSRSLLLQAGRASGSVLAILHSQGQPGKRSPQKSATVSLARNQWPAARYHLHGSARASSMRSPCITDEFTNCCNGSSSLS